MTNFNQASSNLPVMLASRAFVMVEPPVMNRPAAFFNRDYVRGGSSSTATILDENCMEKDPSHMDPILAYDYEKRITKNVQSLLTVNW
eukprot:CAMPEP_0194220042 /NCGR_PEP_ID=MMETSP0156-20130528/27340_1 /TAXON_ID=33649 /ORGANISM="Thalassionema nitzschioides, Strain L26-B" /LENGTH=87 /DNA_ID=CAMNT_0038949909 /DNA_START=127 /DNA_END=387 /DNA_ORIENTATION=+